MDVAFLTLMLCLQAQQIRQLEDNFYTDSLTQVGNRAAFDQALAQAWARYCDSHQDFALMYLDGNNIKVVNDTYGHAAGDQVIVAIADSIRAQGLAFRLGGDEFALLLTHHHLSITDLGLQRLSQHIQHRIWQSGRSLQTQLPIQSMLQGGRQLPIMSAAIGWALASRTQSLVDLQMKADAAMYVNKWRSKRLGRYRDIARNNDARHRATQHNERRNATIQVTSQLSVEHCPPALPDHAEPVPVISAFRARGKAAAKVDGSTPRTVLH